MTAFRPGSGSRRPALNGREWRARAAAWLCLVAIGLAQFAPLAYQAMVQRATGTGTTFVCHAEPSGPAAADPSDSSDHPGACQHCPLCMLLATQAVTPPATSVLPPPLPVPAVIARVRPPRAVAWTGRAAPLPLNPRAPPRFA
ncbi:MAG: DUF2946 family protein [Magnetospirillum sp.]|nr:DUF2946 family protein [Magnetospirillum sp.]